MTSLVDKVAVVLRADWLGRFGLAVVLVGCALAVVTPPWDVNHDCGWYLYVADRILAGDALYVDLMEVNPPLIVYLNMVPAVLAGALSIGLAQAFDYCVALWISISVYCTARVVRDIPVLSRWRHELVAGTVVVLTVCPGGDFGQREHLMVVAVVPWLTMVIARSCGAPVGARLGFFVGCLAGLGIALKPWFLVIPFITRVGVIDSFKETVSLRRPEDRGLLVVLILYGLHFLVVPWSADYGVMVDRLLGTYHGMEKGLWSVMTTPWSVRWLWMFGTACFFVVVARSLRPAVLVLALAGLGCGICAAWQKKGWSYHFLPALTLGYLLLGLMLCRAMIGRHGVRQRFRPLWFLVLTAITAVPVAEHWYRYGVEGLVVEPEFTGIPEDMPQIHELGPGDRVTVLDTDMPRFFAWMADHGVQSASRYGHLWTLPVALDDWNEWQKLLLEITADIRRYEPTLIYVRRDRPSYCRWRNPTFAQRLTALPEMQAALEGYEPVENPGRFDLWRRVQ